MGNGGSKDLKRGAEALKTFKKRVDGVLQDLEDSKASRSKVSEQRVSRASFGGSGGFAEADGLYTQYNRVHKELTELSQTLKDQIEAMQIAVHGADVGFDNLEEDVRRRFWAIQQRTAEREQAAEREKADLPKHTATDKKVVR